MATTATKLRRPEPTVAPIIVRLMRFKETKGTFVYGEVGPDGRLLTEFGEGVVGNLYLRKATLKGQPAPEQITLTLSAGWA